MKRDQLYLTGQNSLEDIPNSNINPLLQRLGACGVQIAHIIPFLDDDVLQVQLADFIKGRGQKLTDGEIHAASIIGSSNVLLGSAAFHAWKSVINPNVRLDPDRRLQMPVGALEFAAMKNSSKDGCKWILAYCLPLTFEDISKHAVFKERVVIDNVDCFKLWDSPGDPVWSNKVMSILNNLGQSGYRLINFSPDSAIVPPSPKEMVLSASNLIQIHLTYYMLRGRCMYASHETADNPHHWAWSEPGLNVYVTVRGGGYKNWKIILRFTAKPLANAKRINLWY